jgi:hypothetical protein
MQSADGTESGHYFADGHCESADPRSECRFISPLRGSLVSQVNPDYLSRLRRSTYFWVEMEGFPILSYEFIGKGLSIVDADEPTTVIAGGGPNGVDIGTCFGFPALNPETRHIIRDMENVSIAGSSQFLAQFDVMVRACSAPTTGSVSETLMPQTGNCSDRSVRTLLHGVPPSPQTVPLCLLNLPTSNFSTDVSYALRPQAAGGVDLPSIWPGLNLRSLELLPHFKTVPVEGVRTLSRPLTRTGERQPNPNGSVTHYFTWRVPVPEPMATSDWSENFSPNLVVARARVRRGPWSPSNHDYINVEYLKVAEKRCLERVPNTNDIDFDIPRCDPGRAAPFRITPAYTIDALNAGRVDDAMRIEWDVRVNGQTATLADTDELFLELDLVAISTVGTSGSGLLGEPAGRNLGQIRTGPAGASLPTFTLRNYSRLSVWVDSITFRGRDAAEFGTPDLQRSGAAAGTDSLLAPLTMPAGSTLQLNVRPAFRAVGVKQADMAIRFHDVTNRSNTLYLALEASAVAPFMSVLPAQVHFYASPGASGHAQAQRAALLSNDGPVPFQRLNTRIVGTHASDFRVLQGEYGVGHSDLSQPLTITSGSAEIYRMGFYPTVPGDREATLLIETTEGTQSVGLHGHCNEHCDHPAPSPSVTEPPVPSVTVGSKKPKVILRSRKRGTAPLVRPGD